MSGTTESDARAAAATEPSATETQTAILPETRTETAPGADTDPPDDTQPAEPPKPATPDPRDRAIRQLAFEQRETRRQLQAAREALERAQPQRDPNAPLTQADFDRVVEQRAQALNEQREAAARSDTWVSAGNAEFADFTSRCNALADMGAAESPGFMQTLGEIPDGHRVIAELADNPAEAARILKLPPIRMALELAAVSARLAAAPPPPAKAVSQAPPPIRPLTTQARADTNIANLDGDAFLRAWQRRKRG